MGKDYFTSVRERRSIYGISAQTVVSDERIQEIVNDSVKYAPSAFNSQSSRVVVLFGDHHEKVWDIAREILRKMVPVDGFAATEERLSSFRSGRGTILFFEDMSIIERLQKDYEIYKDNFPIWSQQASGMLQYIIWTALEAEGLGANLQHYNPLIDEDVKKEWDIPDSWKLIAQMPFGKPIDAPRDKDFMPPEQRIKVYK